MTPRSVDRALLVVCALLASIGCKGSKTSGDAASEDDSEIRLLDKGQRPRNELRYAISMGATTTSTTTFRVATLTAGAEKSALEVLPGLRLDIVSGPAELTDRGVKFNVDVVASKAIVPRDFDEEMAAKLEAGAAIIDQVGGWVEMDDRGRLLAGELSERARRPEVPVRLLRMIVNSRETLTRVRLPKEKVGVGARWESRRQITAYGFDLQQVDTYTLVDRVGDEIMLNVTVQQFAKPQTVELPEQGIQVSVESMTAHAEGQIILDLEALESDASVHGTAEDRLIIKTVDGIETVDITEQFEVQIANTSALLGT